VRDGLRGFKRILSAAGCSAKVLHSAFIHESASRQELRLTVILIPLSCWLEVGPSGMNTLVFPSMEKLDTEFAASVVSYATLLGMPWTPLLIHMQR
jgi:diacylglycerol kinase